MSLLPRVSIIWLNFNGMPIIQILKKSLKGIFSLDYSNYELIIVDNNSTDGSKEAIEEYINDLRPSASIKFLKMLKNVGFCGGINAAYKNRDPNSKYIALVNNDAIPRSSYLRQTIQLMEKNETIGAVQGIVIRLNENQIIDSSAIFIDQILNSYNPDWAKVVINDSNPRYVSYVEGTLPVYRVLAVELSLGYSENMFVENGFMYYLEDVFLSLMMWNHKYNCVILPEISAEHQRGPSIKRFASTYQLPYYYQRNHIALLYMTNSRFKRLYLLTVFCRLFLNIDGLSHKAKIKRQFVYWALTEGRRMGKVLRKKYGTIDLGKIPTVRVSYKKLLFEAIKDLVPKKLLILYNKMDYGIS